MATSEILKKRVYWRVTVGPTRTPVRGIVSFKASAGFLANPFATPDPETVLQKTVYGVLDAQGYLCTPTEADKTVAGARGVDLDVTDDPAGGIVGWVWTAIPEFRSVEGQQLRDLIPSFSFAVLSSVKSVDLSTAVKIPTAPGFGTEQAVALTARSQKAASDSASDAEEARKAAVEAARAAEVAVGPVDDAVVDGILRSNLPSIITASTSGKLDKVTAASLYAPLSALPQTIRHGGDASKDRTSTGAITWVGWVRPANMQTHDVWLEIARPPFNIKTSIDWASLWLASETGVANGSPVSSWADASGNGRKLARATDIGASASPVYRSSVAEFGGKPALEFASSPMETQMPIIGLPFTAIFVARHTKTASSMLGPRTLFYRATAGPIRMSAGTVLDLPESSNSEPHLFVAEFNGENSRVSAGPLAARGNTGTWAMSNGTVYVGGHDAGSHMGGFMALGGIVRGLLDSATKAELASWVAKEYGVSA